MAATGQASFIESLLAPIPGHSPAGGALPDQELFVIERARHFDDGGGGVWERERIDPDWRTVRKLTSEAIAHKSKSLLLAAWFTEASASLDTLPGLTEGLDLLAGLIERFWDRGLLPPSEEGDLSYRATPIEGLNDRASALLRQVPLAKRPQGRSYCLVDYNQSIEAGMERSLIDENGNPNIAKKKRREEIVAAGGTTGDMWQAGVSSTPRAFYESLSASLTRLIQSLAALVKLMDKKEVFGPVEAPSLREIREVTEELQKVVNNILKEKRGAEPDDSPTPALTEQSSPQSPQIAAESRPRTPLLLNLGPQSDSSWSQAEALIRSGDVRAGLEQMTLLAAQEHGRNRFIRRLALAEICLRTNRIPLALVILEELAEQIKGQNLTSWESPELIGRVWGQLYREYKKAGDLKKERAAELYLSLCHLDPWQGLQWAVD